MSAYSTGLDSKCAWPGCGERATREVRNDRNETVGLYCDRHSPAMVERLNLNERKAREESM